MRRRSGAESLQSSRCLPSEHHCKQHHRRGTRREECGQEGRRLPSPPCLRPQPQPLLFVLLERSFTFFPCGSPFLHSLLLFLSPPLSKTSSPSLSLSFSSLLSQPPLSSSRTLELLPGLREIRIPSNTGLPVTSYFIQLEGIKAIKSKRSRQAPVKLGPHGPHPLSFSLLLSAKAAPVFHPPPCLLSVLLALSFTHGWVREKPAIDASNLTKLG